ncbi:hypothetical protein COOONC_27408, partial [Cooperia oncophora]
MKVLQRAHRTRRRRLWPEIAIALTIIWNLSNGCQEVDIFDHQTYSCKESVAEELCTVDTLEIVKIHPFKQEACLRLTSNSTSLLEVKLLWKALDLICEKETVMFTRNTTYGLLDSKRCPHKGLCVGQKCGEQVNHLPGVTGCVESCGGLGCDCFYPSSGCLFYRIYLTPNDDFVYNVFRCTRWRPSVHLEMITNRVNRPIKIHHLNIIPNQPRLVPPATITLSSVSVPPVPLLGLTFYHRRTHTAIAPSGYLPPLRCSSPEEATG